MYLWTKPCYFLLNISIRGAGMNFMTVSTMLSSSSSSPQPAGTAFLGRVRLPSEACSIAAAASASFSSFFLMPYCRNKSREKRRPDLNNVFSFGFRELIFNKKKENKKYNKTLDEWSLCHFFPHISYLFVNLFSISNFCQ